MSMCVCVCPSVCVCVFRIPLVNYSRLKHMKADVFIYQKKKKNTCTWFNLI